LGVRAIAQRATRHIARFVGWVIGTKPNFS
jgi:hypothetical protein